MRSTRRCATGSRTSRTRSTSSARWPDRIPYPMMVRDFNAVVGASAAGRCRSVRVGSPTRSSPASAVAATRWASSIATTSTTRRCGCVGVEAAGDGLDSGHHAASLHARLAGRAARQSHLCAAGRQRTDHRDAFDLGRPRLSRRRSRARVAEGHRARRIRRRDRRPRRWPRSMPAAASRASSRRSNRATRWPTR